MSTYGEKAAGRLFRFEVDQLTVVDETESGVADERVALPLNEALVRSILRLGQLDPILVRINGRADGVGGPRIIEVVDGRQRLKAIRECNKRLAKEGQEPLLVECKVAREAGDDDVARMMVVAANELRVADPPSVRARKALRMREAGHSVADIANAFGIARNQVSDLLALVELDRETKSAVDEGALPLGASKKLAKLSTKERAPVIAEAKRSPEGKKNAALARGQEERGARPREEVRSTKGGAQSPHEGGDRAGDRRLASGDRRRRLAGGEEPPVWSSDPSPGGCGIDHSSLGAREGGGVSGHLPHAVSDQSPSLSPLPLCSTPRKIRP